MNKKTINIFAFLIICMTMTGCFGKADGNPFDKDNGNKSRLVKKIEANIDSMGMERWDKKTYLGIKNNQITQTSKRSEKTALNTLLDATYGNLMVRDAKQILGGACSNQHKLLTNLMDELKSFTQAVGYAELLKEYNTHQQLCNYIYGISRAQSVSNFEEKYDENYDDKVRKEAKAKLNKYNPTCSYIKNNLSNPTAQLNARHEKFCNTIVDLYISSGNYNEGNKNITKLGVSKASTNKDNRDHLIKIVKQSMKIEELQSLYSEFCNSPIEVSKANNLVAALDDIDDVILAKISDDKIGALDRSKLIKKTNHYTKCAKLIADNNYTEAEIYTKQNIEYFSQIQIDNIEPNSQN